MGAFIIILAVAIIVPLGMRCADWIRDLPVPPDPWDAEIASNLESPEATPVCHHCFSPQEHDRWFCPDCGTATGPYNNVMPYLAVFSRGEVLRNGVYHHIQYNGLSVFRYVIFSLCEYGVFAPIYWWFFYKHWRQSQAVPEPDPGAPSPE